MPASLTPGARRILDVASTLFYERGIHAVGVDLIAAESGVTKRTLYDRFGSKDDLVAAYLAERDEQWRTQVAAAVDAGADPIGRVLAPFDVLAEWLPHHADRGCAFVNAFAELDDPAHPGRAVIDGEKRWLTGIFAAELTGARAADPPGTALVLFMLHEGAMVAHAVLADADAARRARETAATLVGNAARDNGR